MSEAPRNCNGPSTGTSSKLYKSQNHNMIRGNFCAIQRVSTSDTQSLCCPFTKPTIEHRCRPTRPRPPPLFFPRVCKWSHICSMQWRLHPVSVCAPRPQLVSKSCSANKTSHLRASNQQHDAPKASVATARSTAASATGNEAAPSPPPTPMEAARWGFWERREEVGVGV